MHVEDHPVFSEGVAAFLVGQGYKNLYQAKDGNEALALLRLHSAEIYLILLDIRMPGMDGLTFFQHLANNHEFPIGTIVLTAFSSDEFHRQFFKIGTEDVMALFFEEKGREIERLLSDIEVSLARVHLRRKRQMEEKNRVLPEQLAKLDLLPTLAENLEDLSGRIENIEKRQHGFLAQLGLDVLKVLLLALFVLAFVYLGLGEYIKKVLESIH